MARRYDNLGEMEVVNHSSPRLDEHIDALEDQVDKLKDENKKLKAKLKAKPKTDYISKEKYEALLVELHKYWDETTPF